MSADQEEKQKCLPEGKLTVASRIIQNSIFNSRIRSISASQFSPTHLSSGLQKKKRKKLDRFAIDPKMLAPLKSRLRLLATKTQSALIEETMRLPKHCLSNQLDDFLRNFSPNPAAGEFLRPSNVTRASKQGSHGSPSRRREKREVPRLYFVQNPLAWLTVKMNFRTLRRTWDPDFQEAEFQLGTKQAISRITELLHANDFASLEPLMTKVGLERLRLDAAMWESAVRENIRLDPEDVQLVIPRKMSLQRVVDRKFCHVDVVCVSLKWMEEGVARGRPAPLLYVDLVARFRRDYTAGNDSDWVVAAFKLRKFSTIEA